MSEPLLPFLLSLSVGIPAILGLIRFKRIDKAFHPFIYFLWAGLIVELLSYTMIRNDIRPAIVSNFYVLLEFVLLLWFFQNWKAFGKMPFLYPMILAALVVAWLGENIIIGPINHVNSYFRISYSVVLVLLSINQVNKIALNEKKANIAGNPVFIICIGFIIFYSFKVLIEIFWLYAFNNFNENKPFRDNVYAIFQYINVFVNLLYALAVLWIPKKKTFTRPS